LDDDLSVCRGLKMHLEILGYKVLVFHIAKRLLTCALPTGDDVCLLADVYLPPGWVESKSVDVSPRQESTYRQF
jgi:FixJ family two-component response regulator